MAKRTCIQHFTFMMMRVVRKFLSLHVFLFQGNCSSVPQLKVRAGSRRTWSRSVTIAEILHYNWPGELSNGNLTVIAVYQTALAAMCEFLLAVGTCQNYGELIYFQVLSTHKHKVRTRSRLPLSLVGACRVAPFAYVTPEAQFFERALLSLCVYLLPSLRSSYLVWRAPSI